MLKRKYNLQNYDFYRYLQLRQYYLKEIRKNEATTELSGMIQLVVQAYTAGPKSLVSKLYQNITKCRRTTTTYIKQRWEKELNDKISNQEWENMCETIFSTSCSMYWREFGWKNLVRFFVTPKMKARLTPKRSTCWRDCGEEGVGHHHIFWSCPKIQIFWEHIWRIMQHILGQQIPMTCMSLYLGDLPEGMSGNDKYLLKILTVAAKKAITRRWLQSIPPTVDDWKEIVKESHEMERLTFLLRLRKDVYTAR